MYRIRFMTVIVAIALMALIIVPVSAAPAQSPNQNPPARLVPPGVTVTLVSGVNAEPSIPGPDLAVYETGASTASYSVVLNTQPTADVTIAITLTPDRGDVTVAPLLLTFTTANWNVPQVVNIAAIDEALDDGTYDFTMSHVATSGDANYNAIAIENVVVLVVDNDSSEVTVNPTSGLITTEAGGTANFTVVLTSAIEAGDSVCVNLSTPDTDEISLSTGQVMFDSTNWNVPQTVTVTGVQDNIIDGNQPWTVVTSNAVSPCVAENINYGGLGVDDVTGTNQDSGVTPTPEPTTVTPEPTTVTPEPTTVTPEPTTVTPEPTTVTPEPTTVTPEPTVVPTEIPTEEPTEEPTPEPTPVPGCDAFVQIPASAVGGKMRVAAVAQWAPGKDTSPEVVLDAGKSVLVLQQDASGAYYQVLWQCQKLWVPFESVGPNYNYPWNGAPLP